MLKVEENPTPHTLDQHRQIKIILKGFLGALVYTYWRKKVHKNINTWRNLTNKIN